MSNKPFPFTVCKECCSGSGGGTNGLSAYEIAVKNGFKGTEEEWLESLQGETPVKGVDYWTEEDKAEIQGYIDEKTGSIEKDLDTFDRRIAGLESDVANIIDVDLPAIREDIGDTETALDRIIAIQNELIGGDAE